MSALSTNRHYALAVLTLVYVFNFVDRQLLAILLEPIKQEFNASDTAMGLLYGFSFAVFYAGLAIPVARLADRGHRRNIVAIAAALWSGFTVLCGIATNYWQLFLFRTGVAVGEAGGVPPSQSMITDHYPPEQRSMAMAIFSSATFIGSLVAFIGGAWIAENYGWRLAFIVVGAPGILLALVLRYTTKEPERGRWDAKQLDQSEPLGFMTTLNGMWRSDAMRFILIGCAFASMAGYALGYWAPSFLIRVHGLSVVKAGAAVGIIGITCGLIGSLAGAAVCDKLAKRNRQWLLYVPALSLTLSLPLMLGFLLWPQANTFALSEMTIPVALGWFAIASLLGSWWAAPTYVAVQEVVPANQRTLACAILLFMMNLFGFGLGPFLVGVLSDGFSSAHGDFSIRYALAWMMSGYVIAIICYWLAGRNFDSFVEPKPFVSTADQESAAVGVA